MILGEAAARLDDATRAQFPLIPFSKIVGMRNRIVHNYDNLDFIVIGRPCKNMCQSYSGNSIPCPVSAGASNAVLARIAVAKALGSM